MYNSYMTKNISVPDIGDFKDVEIIEILVKTGDKIKKDDPIVTLESDKSSVEVPSPFEGKISELKVKIGDRVSKGSILATLEGEDVKKEEEKIEPKKFIKKKKTEELKSAIQEANDRSINNQTDFFAEFLTVANNRELRLFRNYNNLATTRDNESVVEELKIQRDNAIASALEIIRNRIDEFGVSEPTIQKYGANRIIVELAGVQDSDRARNLIQRTASLEFTLVLNEQWEQALNKIDTYLLSDSSALNIDLESPNEKE